VHRALWLLLSVATLTVVVALAGPAQMLRAVAAAPGWLPLSLAALAAVGFALDAAALRLCVGVPIAFGTCFLACVTSMAVNAVTPLGQAGEWTKYRRLRGAGPAARIGAGILLHNYLMGASAGVHALAALLAGALILPVSPVGLPLVLSAALVAAAVTAGSAALLSPGLLERAQRLALRAWPRLGRGGLWQAAWVAAGDVPRRPRALAAGFALSLGKRAVVLAEAVLILRALSTPDAAIVATVATGFAQAVTWGTSFVPGGAGEAGSFLLFPAIGLSPALGVAFELIRRARRLGTAAAGLTALALVRRPPAEPPAGASPSDA
jgi:hypothetical protein